MAGKRKLEHFAEMKTFRNVYEPTLEEVHNQDYSLKGKWRANHFKNDLPIVLELGCGKGEYTLGLARKYPKKNFIGVDIKGARMWRGAKTAIEEGLNNVAFLRTRIEFISSCFGLEEVDEIWITFPDPQAKDRREKKRLTGPQFIEQYKGFLKKEAFIHLKTDSNFFYEYSLDQAISNKYLIKESSDDLYGQKIADYDQSTQEILSIQTHYEKLFMEKGHKIHYLKFGLND